MESQPQNPEFRNNPENFHPWAYSKLSKISNTFLFRFFKNKMLVTRAGTH